MGEGYHAVHDNDGYQQHQFLLSRPHVTVANSRIGRSKAGGEIVEIEGGHIVRSIGRKDRHSKVCTAKGPRDRRVRLSAHTAIQFYDVQDRLGYDRPSKAVDWLMKNAKAAIDELAKLPPWHPTASPSQQQDPLDAMTDDMKAYGFGEPSSSYLPPSLDSDSIADTIKSFFPSTGKSAPSSSSPTGFHAQDLKLSLQSFQDPMLLHHHHQSSSTSTTNGLQTFFSSSNTPLIYDTSTSTSWSEHQTKAVPWSNEADTSGGDGSGRGGYAYRLPPQPLSSPPQGVPLHSLIGQNSFLSQRGPLQSSYSPSMLAWVDPTIAASAANDNYHQLAPAFTSGSFAGFRIPDSGADSG